MISAWCKNSHLFNKTKREKEHDEDWRQKKTVADEKRYIIWNYSDNYKTKKSSHKSKSSLESRDTTLLMSNSFYFQPGM